MEFYDYEMGEYEHIYFAGIHSSTGRNSKRIKTISKTKYVSVRKSIINWVLVSILPALDACHNHNIELFIYFVDGRFGWIFNVQLIYTYTIYIIHIIHTDMNFPENGNLCAFCVCSAIAETWDLLILCMFGRQIPYANIVSTILYTVLCRVFLLLTFFSQSSSHTL